MPSLRARRVALMAIALLPAATLAVSSPTATLAAEDAVRDARLGLSEQRVRIGQSVRLTGAFPGAGHRAVEIRTRRKGTKRWRLVARTRTAKAGRFSERVRPRATGIWRAELAHPERVGARPDEDDEVEPTEPTGPAPPARVDSRTRPKWVAVRSRSSVRVSNRNPLVGESVTIKGRVVPGGARRRVVLHAGGTRLTTRTGAGWLVQPGWSPDSTGHHRIRVRARANAMALGSGDGGGRVQAFRRAAASWYGPGFYGNRTACGGTLGYSTLGVAHKTMPCGTRLTLRYQGREVRVRVIDRGPYVAGREFDLTGATKARLGFGSTGTVLSSR
jgi:peptidoglycan lytic transglycosylase